MTPKLNTSPSALEQLADLTQTLEKEKVELTPEVEEYVRNHVRAVQDKLQAGEDVYEKDLEFIGNVKLWVLMPKEWREKYGSVEEMKKSEEMKDITATDAYEAIKRNISLKQWVDLLQLAKQIDEEKNWIDKTFTFGGENIEVKDDLYLGHSEDITSLPEGLKIERSLILAECTGLKSLPEKLIVGNNLNLNNCTGLTSLPEKLVIGGDLELQGCTGLTSLPKGFSVGRGLYLNDCTGLTSLPEKLVVNHFLNISGCTGLTSLPEGLEIWGTLILSQNLHEQVKKDAEKLKKGGVIEGRLIRGIEYDNQ